jgi:HAMP domain-containing protein
MSIKNLKLHQKLLLHIGSLLLFCFAGFLGMVFYTTITTTKENILKKELPLTTGKVVALVQQAAMKPALYAEVSTNNEFLLDWLQGDMQDMEVLKRFLQQVENEEGMFSATVVSERNKNVYEKVGILKNIADRGPDYWYNQLKRSTNEMELIIAAPKYNGNSFSIFANQKLYNQQGKLLGVAGYGLELEKTIDKILALRSDEENRIFITDYQGQKIIYNNKNLKEDFVPNVLNEEGLKQHGSSLLAARSGQFKYKRDGKTYLADVVYLPELKWYIFNEVNQDRLFAPVYKRFFLIVLCALLALGLVLALLYYLVRTASRPIYQLANLAEEVKEGKLDFELKIDSDVQEVNRLSNSFEALTKNLQRTSRFALEIEQGNLSADFQTSSEHDVLGKALIKMRNALLKVEKEGQQRQWANEGLAKFSNILRHTGEQLDVISNRLISELVKYLNANQGAIFIVQQKEEDEVLEMTGCYAYGRKKYRQQSLHRGEGLAGQAWLEQDSIYMNDIPQNYIRITSGLGEALPTNLLIVPLKNHEQVLGIIELASFQQIEPYQREFVERLAEGIAASLAMVKTSSLTQRLLEETQTQAEQLRTQEEEMRQHLIELFDSKQAMEEKEQKQAEEIKRLKNLIEEYEQRMGALKA